MVTVNEVRVSRDYSFSDIYLRYSEDSFEKVELHSMKPAGSLGSN